MPSLQDHLRKSPELGVGIGLRVPHYEHILSRTPQVDWFEIISENYLVDGGRPLEVLDQILEQYQVIQHGVALYAGSPGRPERKHLKRLKSLVARTNTPWVSDHLCWGSVDGTYSHDLLPLPYTFETAAHVAENLRECAETLERPMVVENLSSYAEFNDSIMTEWEFVSEVAERADCGILLDVNNIYVSSVNHGYDPYDYLENVPHERVVQMHIAGHSAHERFIIDTHDRPVADPVWAIYRRAIELCGPTPTLLEWDAHIPSFEEVAAEAGKASAYYNHMAEDLGLKLATTGLKVELESEDAPIEVRRKVSADASTGEADAAGGSDGENWAA